MGAAGPLNPKGRSVSEGPERAGFLERSGREEPAQRAGKKPARDGFGRAGPAHRSHARAGKWARDRCGESDAKRSDSKRPGGGGKGQRTVDRDGLDLGTAATADHRAAIAGEGACRDARLARARFGRVMSLCTPPNSGPRERCKTGCPVQEIARFVPDRSRRRRIPARATGSLRLSPQQSPAASRLRRGVDIAACHETIPRRADRPSRIRLRKIPARHIQKCLYGGFLHLVGIERMRCCQHFL